MKHTYSVTGMTCSSCAQKLQEKLQSHPAITDAKVEKITDTAVITFSDSVSLEDLNAFISSLGRYTLTIQEQKAIAVQNKSLKTYYPLLLVLAYIIAGTFYLASVRSDFTFQSLMPDFMGLFFVWFAFFKLLDVRGFATSYRSYDIPTKYFLVWGYIYPFVELGLGILYLTRLDLCMTNILTVILMSVSIVGVIQSVVQKREVKCACLGTGFNLPMSTVTIVEDGLMIAMALLGIIS